MVKTLMGISHVMLSPVGVRPGLAASWQSSFDVSNLESLHIPSTEMVSILSSLLMVVRLKLPLAHVPVASVVISAAQASRDSRFIVFSFFIVDDT